MNTNIFRFSTAGEIVSGADAATALSRIVATRSSKRVLLLSDANIARSGLLDAPAVAMQGEGATVTVFSEVVPEPPSHHVDELQNRFRSESFDLIVAIGGGSVLDVAKLLSVLIGAPFRVEDIVGIDKVPSPGIPVAALPTTAGTGSEVTPNAIVTLVDQQLKVGIVSRFLLPSVVVLDPALTVGMPAAVTASTGIDAFIHSLESVTSNKANAMCNAVGFHSMRLIYPSLPRAYRDATDLSARYDMLLGSMLGGMALSAAGTTAVHALSYPLGGTYGIPHGVANAMMLLPVMEYNFDTLSDDFADIAVLLGIEPAETPPRNRAESFLQALRNLVAEVQIPTDLRDFGVSPEDIDTLSTAASKVTRLLDNNRKKLSTADIRAMYERAFASA